MVKELMKCKCLSKSPQRSNSKVIQTLKYCSEFSTLSFQNATLTQFQFLFFFLLLLSKVFFFFWLWHFTKAKKNICYVHLLANTTFHTDSTCTMLNSVCQHISPDLIDWYWFQAVTNDKFALTTDKHLQHFPTAKK